MRHLDVRTKDAHSVGVERPVGAKTPDLGRPVRRVRELVGISPDQLARAAGVSPIEATLRVIASQAAAGSRTSLVTPLNGVAVVIASDSAG